MINCVTNHSAAAATDIFPTTDVPTMQYWCYHLFSPHHYAHSVNSGVSSASTNIFVATEVLQLLPLISVILATTTSLVNQLANHSVS